MKRSIILFFSFLFAALVKADITVGENQMWWGYFNTSDASNLPYDGNIGYGSSCTIDAAIHIPASEDIVAGSTIKAVRLWLGDDISGISSSLRVWISTSCPKNSTSLTTYKQTVTKANIKAGLNEIALATPFEVNHRELYVGFTFNINQKTFPVMSYGSDFPGGFLYRINNGNWQDFYGSEYGRLALQLLVEAESFPTNCVTASDFGQSFVLKGKRTTIPVTFTNKGTNPVKSLSYTITSKDGSSTVESTKTFTSSPMGLNGTKTFNIIFNADNEARKSKKILTVTKANGEPNTSSHPSGTGFIITLGENKPVTPVIEEFTGTWCGYCPRGMVGMEKVHDTYGEKVVQIAAHYGDVMAINEYQPVINAYTSGFPNSITDRQFEADPSFSGLRSALNSAWNRVSQGSIELYAEWNDAKQTAVSFTTLSTFSYSDDDSQYAIALIITEDGLTGTGSNWAQSNYYSGAGSGGDMSFWYKSGNPVTGVKYNHVPVIAWEPLYGIEGSVSKTIEAGKADRFDFVGSLEKNTLIQDKTQLKAVALLIDRSTGKIVNAAQSDIKEKGTGIGSASSDSSTPAAYYSIDGRKLPTPEKGINIIRMSDGSVKKVLVK